MKQLIFILLLLLANCDFVEFQTDAFNCSGDELLNTWCGDEGIYYCSPNFRKKELLVCDDVEEVIEYINTGKYRDKYDKYAVEILQSHIDCCEGGHDTEMDKIEITQSVQ